MPLSLRTTLLCAKNPEKPAEKSQKQRRSSLTETANWPSASRQSKAENEIVAHHVPRRSR